MENSPLIRFRIDREIAERAHRMAAERGLELPDVMRMMLTKAVRIGDFSIDQEHSGTQRSEQDRSVDAYEPQYWADERALLDAQTAIALLYQAIADSTALLDESLAAKRSVELQGASRLMQLRQVRKVRDEACALLAAFGPKDPRMVADILLRFQAPNNAAPDGGAE